MIGKKRAPGTPAWIGLALLALGGIAAPALDSDRVPPAEPAEASVPADPRALIPESTSFDLPEVEGTRHELYGGAVAFVVPDSILPLVQIVVAVPAGERLDPPGKRGLAGLTAALLRRGGTRSLSPAALDEQADRLAAELDSFALVSRAGATLEVARWNLEEALDLLFQILSEPRFDPRRVLLFRRNLRESLDSGRSDPERVGSRAWEWITARPGEPGRNPLVPESVEGLDRSEMVAFHRRYWSSREMVFAVSGDVETESLVRSLNRRLRDWPRSDEGSVFRREGAMGRSDRPEIQGRADTGSDPEAEPGADGSRSDGRNVTAAVEGPAGLWLLDLDVEGAVVLVGHRLDPGESLEPRERVASRLLEELIAGEGGVNRIVGRLRTAERLVYRVDSEMSLRSERPGRWLTLFSIAPERVGPALAALTTAVERLRSEPISPREMEALRSAVLGEIRSRFDTAEGIAGTYAEDELIGRDHRVWTELVADLDEIESDDVLNAARRSLRLEDATVVVAGPRGAVEAGLREAEGLPDSWTIEASRAVPRRLAEAIGMGMAGTINGASSGDSRSGGGAQRP